MIEAAKVISIISDTLIFLSHKADTYFLEASPF